MKTLLLISAIFISGVAIRRERFPILNGSPLLQVNDGKSVTDEQG